MTENAGISDHNTSVGAAQGMVASRIPISAIIQAGSGKSTAMAYKLW